MTWEHIKSLASSKLAKLTILMPFVGWLILYNRELADLLSTFATNSIQEVDYTVSWRIHMFYIGMFLIGISSMLYTVGCPSEISSYNGFSDYAKSTKFLLTPNSSREMANFHNYQEIKLNLGPPGNTEENITQADFLHYNALILNDLLDHIYKLRNSSRTHLIYICTSLFVSGSIMAFVPSAYTLWWAIKETYNQLVAI